MIIFDVAQAQHFCSGYAASAGIATRGLKEFFRTSLITQRRIAEGSVPFAEYRDCLLRESERNLFLSAALFRRGLDQMSTVSASWLQVSYYYSTFYSARSLMGFCGCWVDSPRRTEVLNGNPGSQEIEVVRNFGTRTTYRGSHQQFWDSFYRAVASWAFWVPPEYRAALVPVRASVTWLIDERNRFNYDSLEALDLISQFQTSFRKGSFPSSLPGQLNTQFTIAEKMLLLSCWLARQCRVQTDAFNRMPAGPTRGDAIRRYVYDAKAVRLGAHGRRQQVLKT